jgi:hypothetical protein
MIKRLGYNTIDIGKKKLHRIIENTNSARYNTYKGKNLPLLPIKKEIDELFNLPKIFDEAIPHKINVCITNPNKLIRVFNIHDEEIPGSPFKNSIEISKIMGCDSSYIKKMIKSGKLYKNKYYFKRIKKI